MRVVGLQEGQRKRLTSFQQKMESVELKNCEVRRGRRTDELEIVLKS